MLRTRSLPGLPWTQPDRARPTMALVILWSRDEPERAGEVAVVPDGVTAILGRESKGTKNPIVFECRRPPPLSARTGPLRSPHLSRDQLELRNRGNAIEVRNRGKVSLEVSGQASDRAVVSAGALLTLPRLLTLLCIQVPVRLAPLDPVPAFFHYGAPDGDGLVGESPALWTLRQQVAFAAARPEHVLVHGATGTGKELVARAIHRRSERGDAPLITCSIESFEVGLLGEADGTTLLLDGVGPETTPSGALLRALDTGELRGPDGSRRADFRLIVCTRSPPSKLQPALASRLPLPIAVPGLADRREDIPLLVRAGLRRMARTDAALARFFAGPPAQAEPNLDAALLEDLATREHRANVRGLDAAVVAAIAQTAPDETRLGPARTPATPDAPQRLLRLEACLVDLRKHTVVRADGTTSTLTRTERRLLRHLADHPDRAITREELLTEVWNYKPDIATNTVANTMRRLRVKVERDPSEPRHLLSVYGVGYRFAP